MIYTHSLCWWYHLPHNPTYPCLLYSPVCIICLCTAWKLVTQLVLWAQSTSKDYIRAENKLQSISKLVIPQVIIPQVLFFFFSLSLSLSLLFPETSSIFFVKRQTFCMAHVQRLGEDSWSVVCAACCHMTLVFAVMHLYNILDFFFFLLLSIPFLYFF